MNQIILKKAVIFSFLLGAVIGIASILPFMIGFNLFILSFCSSVIILLYMRNNEKHLSYLTNEQGAIMGGVIGFFTTIGFFATFTPLVFIIHLIFKNYYAYMIPDLLTSALWLFFVLVFMVGIIFALTNSATGMGVVYFLGKMQPTPDNLDARLDIKIED